MLNTKRQTQALTLGANPKALTPGARTSLNTIAGLKLNTYKKAQWITLGFFGNALTA
ncbi:hypothetical protein [Alteromonas stellipolaris]|uniref:Uncharacterized protein n=1 Tax=Alteromonas stellipolaris TaxID=233316 RepID=A0AAW7YZL4_9ALTE|nr:hypothetical protein [Alteromonas stellipolaris]ALM90822.1 hypothetical protein AOR13_1788 [Alteromonas stellipolaris LMG 21856]MDO6575776.1 hypothetical protein [Alteromonas stellipolaris]